MLNRAAALLPDLAPLGRASDFLEDILEVLRPLALFEGFSAQECGELCDYLACFGAPTNAAIIREGEPGNFLVIVLTGMIRVVKRGEDGEPRVVAEAGPGAFLGEMSLIDGKPRFASCLAAAPADLAVLTRDGLNALMVDHPRLGQKLLLMLLRLMAARLRETTQRMLPYLAEGPV
ncbi:MAG: cyclic nucleotide-binding domain-containing protein [Burkholderiales bacterium]|nr:cyclic nucleotide-binding domain-containing protein [Burkholderiales bacterium]